MARRCPDCAKFVSLENADPEVEVDVQDNCDGTATITGTVRVARQCADCSNELLEANFDVDVTVEDIPHGGLPEDGKDDGKHELVLETDSEEVTESGGGRYARNMVGFGFHWTLTCKDCKDWHGAEGTVEDALAASEYDELT